MKHILMVDDVTTNLKCISEVLRSSYQLSLAKSGEQALKFLQNNTPDLILLDINMPDMDGYETLEKIRNMQGLENVPVVFLTADTDQEAEIKGLRMGARDFIRKPIEPQIMTQRIENVLQIEETRRQLEFSSRIDVLTNLWNRSRLEEVVDEYGKGEGASGVFMMMDMDNFKGINDNFGHGMGDTVLIKFAETLQQNARKDDLVCRIGGDEFAAFFTGKIELDVIREKAEHMIVEIAEQVNEIKGTGHDVSVSIGIARMPVDGSDFQELYGKADKALYYVKQNGKCGYHFYQEEDNYTSKPAKTIDTMIDLIQLKDFIEEKSKLSGAYQVEYNGFRRIYQFISRCVDCSKQDVQVVLFSIRPEGDGADSLQMESTMRALEQSVAETLRRGDVATEYSTSQYVVILLDANYDNSKKVISRIQDRFYDKVDRKEFFLGFDIQTIHK
ncbi:MAG: diguanylate cyclase [Lachnospiraceae bacterium]|nr:diguanylate cyclase [Lachnospiraceae bacterium]